MTKKSVAKMKPKEVLQLLQRLIEKLDEEDLEDVFGTEGWRHRYGFEED